MSENIEREKILARVREALRAPAPHPGAIQPGSADVSHPAARAREWLPQAGTTPQEVFNTFQRVAGDLKAEIVVAADRPAMVAALKAMRDAGQWTSIATHNGELTAAAAPELGLPVTYTDTGYETAALEKSSAGLTECDALVAQTGSVLLTARSAGGRALSVLPPHHVVLARRSQLIRDLPEAFELIRRKYGNNYPSFISFTTGPSRTGDIERILVLGAHGPKRLTVIVLDHE